MCYNMISWRATTARGDANCSACAAQIDKGDRFIKVSSDNKLRFRVCRDRAGWHGLSNPKAMMDFIADLIRGEK